jgi:hypothetical protein
MIVLAHSLSCPSSARSEFLSGNAKYSASYLSGSTGKLTPLEERVKELWLKVRTQ